MGYRFRKRIKIFPGLHITLSPSGISTSLGVTGARITLGSTGRVTRTLGIPGTGFYHMETLGQVGKKRTRGKEELPPGAIKTATGEVIVPGPPGYPNIFSRKYEKKLYSAIQIDTPEAMSDLIKEHPETAIAAGFFLTYYLLRDGKEKEAHEAIAMLWKRNQELATDPLFLEYVNPHVIEVTVGPGAKFMTRIDRDCVGLIYGEILQRAEKIQEAIEVVESLTLNQGAALSLADLYIQSKEWDKIIEITDEITNDDDLTALMLVYRGVAFREKGFNDAAKEVFKKALSPKKRSETVRHRAMTERAKTYINEGKKALARKEAEKIMAEDPEYEGIREINELLA